MVSHAEQSQIDQGLDQEVSAEQVKRGRGRPSRTGLKRSRHCVYDINYHIVFTTKFRRKVITAEILELIIQQTSDIAEKWGCNVIEMNGEAEHVHFLLSAPPNFNLSELIGNIKTITSRTV
jgi:putative transposase